MAIATPDGILVVQEVRDDGEYHKFEVDFIGDKAVRQVAVVRG